MGIEDEERMDMEGYGFFCRFPLNLWYNLVNIGMD